MASTPEVLRHKRKQLEQEITEFKIKKEEEYRSFERQVSQGAHEGIKPIDSKDDYLGSISISRPRGQNYRGQKVAQSPYDDSGSIAFDGDTGKLREDSHANADSPGMAISSVGHRSGPEALSFAQRHERELEFQGLFTPDYLPLHSGRRTRADTRDHDVRRFSEDVRTTSMNQEGTLGSNRQNTASFSASATFPSDHLRSSPSPPPIRTLSASVPRQQSHHRRTSSRSDISITSLRSSLRDPKQPRSPKRVLFSLDNGVVSPSTSPVAQRTKPGQNAMSPETFKAPQPLGNFGAVAIGNTNDAANAFEWTGHFSGGASTDKVANGKNTDRPASTRSSGFANTSPTIGGDDFERIDAEDELFAFDEEITDGEAVTDTKTDAEDEIESDVDEEIGDLLTASSPHAGSLPIEIRWPPRLGPQR